MKTVECAHEFCDPLHHGYNLPAYSLDARSETDIIQAMSFASSNGLKVSVKTTGYSLQGSSTMNDSFLIYMNNFPKDDEIIQNYVGRLD